MKKAHGVLRQDDIPLKYQSIFFSFCSIQASWRPALLHTEAKILRPQCKESRNGAGIRGEVVIDAKSSYDLSLKLKKDELRELEINCQVKANGLEGGHAQVIKGMKA